MGANKLITPANPGTSRTGKTTGGPGGRDRSAVLRNPTAKDPILTGKTPVTGKQGGKMGTKLAKLGPTPVGVHGPKGVHSAIKGATRGGKR